MAKKLRIHKRKNTKMSFMTHTKQSIEFDLPSLGRKLRKNRKLSKGRVRPSHYKMRLMSPPVMRKNRLDLESQDIMAKCDQDQIHDNAANNHVSEAAQDAMNDVGHKTKVRKKKNRSISNIRKLDPAVLANLKCNSNNMKLLKLRDLVNKDYNLQK